MKTVTVEEFKKYAGKELGASKWFKIDQERINNFADVTIDHQFIHVDTEKAKATPFGCTIAHGFLTLSLLTYLQESIEGMISPAGLKMGMNYGFDKVRFLAPVKVNSRIRSVAKVLSITEKKPGQLLVNTEFTIEIEGEEKPALIAEWLLMYFV